MIKCETARDYYKMCECNDMHCESFAHSVAFTHDAIMDLCCPISVNNRGFDLTKYTYHELAYLYGCDCPRYQVPMVI